MNSRQSIREFYLTSLSPHIFVRTAGDLDTDTIVINIHGGVNLSHRYLLDLDQLATPQRTVVNYDQRGCGRSFVSIHQKGLRVDDFVSTTYAQDLEEVRKAVAGQKKVHLLGHSWGGYIAMDYAVKYPEYVNSLTLVGTAPPTWDGFRKGMRHFNTCLQNYQQKGLVPMELSEDPLEALKQMLPVYVFPTDPPFTLPIDAFEVSQNIIPQVMKTVQNYDLREPLAHLNLPVLILFGDTDPFGVQCAEETKSAFIHANVDMKIIPNCGHFVWMEQPEIFFHTICNFLDQNS